MIIIEKNTDVKIKCYKCGNEHPMNMMRMDPNGKNLVCRGCLDRKVSSNTAAKEEAKSQKNQEKPPIKKNFKRLRRVL